MNPKLHIAQLLHYVSSFEIQFAIVISLWEFILGKIDICGILTYINLSQYKLRRQVRIVTI